MQEENLGHKEPENENPYPKMGEINQIENPDGKEEVLEIFVGDYIVDKDGKTRLVWGDDMPDLKYEDIVRQATFEERLKAEGITEEEFKARELCLWMVSMVNHGEISYLEMLDKIKDRIDELSE